MKAENIKNIKSQKLKKLTKGFIKSLVYLLKIIILFA